MDRERLSLGGRAMSRTAPLALLGLCAMLAIAIAYELFAPLRPVAVDANARRIAFAAPSRLVPPPEENFAEIDARPVFNPARTPVPDLAQSGNAEGSPLDLLLEGVILAPDRSIAVLKDKNTSQTVSVAVGAFIDGWRVEAIDKSEVSLASANGRFALPLSNPTAGVTPVTPPPQPTTSPQPLLVSSPPTITAATPAAKEQGKPGLLMPTAHGNIAPEALKGAPVDPSTGEPTL